MKVLYFAWVREKAGLGAEDIKPPDTVTDVAGFFSFLGIATVLIGML